MTIKGEVMNFKKIYRLFTGVMIFSVFCLSGCAGPSLYSVNMYYDAEKSVIPAYLKVDGQTSGAVVAVAEFTDTRQIDDPLIIGRVIQNSGAKILVFPRNVKPTKAVANGIKQYLKKAGYKITEINEQWNLNEDKIPMGNAKILIGGNIEELEITCRKGNLTNSYNTNMTLAIVIADITKGRILYRTRVKSIYAQEHVLFSENILGQQADMVLSDAIEKLFEDKKVAQTIKAAMAN